VVLTVLTTVQTGANGTGAVAVHAEAVAERHRAESPNDATSECPERVIFALRRCQ
jgi:hypothetical protein